MNTAEKLLYHQIHPAKLLTDCISTIPVLYLFWQHQLIFGLIFAIVPPILASVVVIRFADLEKYKATRFGHYVARYMTNEMQALRLVGFIVMAVGAWYHGVWILIPSGLVIVLLAWSSGKIFRME